MWTIVDYWIIIGLLDYWINGLLDYCGSRIKGVRWNKNGGDRETDVDGGGGTSELAVKNVDDYGDHSDDKNSLVSQGLQRGQTRESEAEKGSRQEFLQVVNSQRDR